MLHHLRAQSRVAGAEQDLAVTLAAGRAGQIVPGMRDSALGRGAQTCGAEHRHPLGRTAAQATLAAGLQGATLAAQKSRMAFNLRPGAEIAGIEAHRFGGSREPGVVDLVEELRNFAGLLRYPAHPPGRAALRALDQRQVHTVRLRFEIGRATQPGQLRRWTDPAHHPPQFSQPQLHP